ncbi:hypothetical protein B4U79_06269 [Dinothrombium tinctorium]|nr:hypothetical protein B4U79_06269 [Dinothrombium tinctorium]
MINYTTR